jgi:hypothetical protein
METRNFPWPWVALTALAITVAGALLLQRFALDELRAEVATARQESQRLAAVRAEHQRLAALGSAAELETLRAEHAALEQRRALSATAAAATATPAAPVVVATTDDGMRPAATWLNVGRATPATAAETLLFAASTGNLDTMADGIFLDPASRTKAQALWEGLPDTTHQHYSSPEKLVALFVTRNTGEIAAMQVLRAEETAPDAARVQLRLQNDQGERKEMDFQFRRSDDGWRLVVPEKLIDNIGAMLTRPLPRQ